MARASAVYICQQCGYRSSQYLGRCPECGSWGALAEEVQNTTLRAPRVRKVAEAEVVNLKDLAQQSFQRLSSGISEFDRVLGRGIVLGSVVLISGDPGVGKSTLLTELALKVGLADGSKVLYVAGEESAQQIKIRSDRIQKGANFPVLQEVDVDTIVGVIEKLKPQLVIIDSIQALETVDLESVAGSVGQVRESAHRLQRVAKYYHIPIFLIGHVTKEGTVAGPRSLEHLVDVALSLEGDPTSAFRVLRASKNRFGSTDEVGIFEMEESGMIEVKNPSKLFLDQKVNAPGSAVVVTMQGLRPLLVEVQALVTKTTLPYPKRTVSGIDNHRLELLIATLTKRLNLPLFDQDIFVNVTGGLRLTETASDLGVCMAIVSSFKNRLIKDKTALVGEVGLLGELRVVRQVDKRVTEAKKLGFSHIITPQNTKSLPLAMKLALK